MVDTERVMIDIETLGLNPGCAVLSLGAVKFDQDGIRDPIYETINLESCQEAGLRIDADTLMWWLDQDDTVSTVLQGGHPLEEVLETFTDYYPEDAEIWANSPSFDCDILAAAYEAVGQTAPWEFYNERCYRTLQSLPYSVEVEHTGDEHHALDDAAHQAESVAKTLSVIEDSFQ